MTQFAVVVACLLVAARAEPPVAPSTQYGAPQGGSAGLSSQYGVPGRFGGQGGQGQAGYPSGSNGQSGGFSPSGYGGDENSEPANYEFQYDVEAREEGLKFGHQEARQGDVAQGKYYVLLPDGRTQVVEYVADQDGYRPKISYVEAEGQGGYSSGRPNQGGSSGGGFNSQGGYSASQGHAGPEGSSDGYNR